MGKITGFLEIYLPWAEEQAREQAGRCMDCGIPFCNYGCPLGNLIPDWNDMVYKGDWKRAIDQLHATNNFPEFTGRICPAPCEPACTLSINKDAVTIEMIEKAITDRAWEEGWIKPTPPLVRTGKTVAVIGSGPAGLACAQQLNRAGHLVTVFERNEYIGGLLSLGIPDFKLEKALVDRRVEQLSQEGILFSTGAWVGQNVPTDQLKREFDAICLCGGATVPRDLQVPGRELDGVHFAMDYLSQQNRRNRGQDVSPSDIITAKDKTVVILGGGDTGADCLGTAHRQGAKRVYQFELLPRPSSKRGEDNPWPQWPYIFRTSAAHEEGGELDFNILTKSFNGENGKLNSLTAVRLSWQSPSNGGRPQMVEIPGSEVKVETELVLLAMGFLHGESKGLLDELGVGRDERGNVATDSRMMTSVPGVFAGGDMQRGQSLVVHAIASGRMTARGCDEWLMGRSDLPLVRGYARTFEKHPDHKIGAALEESDSVEEWE
ncbi:MAG: glutamate synthase small subunit [Dehalococcoidia bacterium]|nr:glutamate synthase small subunit [Dehalococcoidia bacterium]